MERLKKSIGTRLRQRRTELGFANQVDLAIVVGVDQSRVSRWETGSELPEGENRRALCKALKITDDFFDLPPEFDPISDEDIGKVVLGLIAAAPVRRAYVLFLATRDRAYLEPLSQKERQALQLLDLA